MNDGAPTLEVGFAINPEFDQLRQLQDAMNSTEARVVAEAARIEQATSGMVKLGGATAQITTFGGAATRELANVARETKAAERAGEGMVRQLERQAMVFGKTASEVRQMRTEMRAAAAEQTGLTELAGRIRAAGAEIDRLESGVGQVGGTGRLAGHHVQNLAFQFQDLGIQMASAAGSSAPLRMAFMALLQQGPQIQGIMSQAGIGFGEMLKQAGLMTGVLREVSVAEKAVSGAKQVTAAANGSVAASNVAVSTTAKIAATAEQQLSLAFGAAATGAGAAAAANGQLAASNGAVAAGAGRMAAVTATVLSPLGVAALAVAAGFAVAAVSIRQLQNAANEDSGLGAYAASLGLSAKEIRNLDDVTVTFGDTTKAVFQVAGRAIWGQIGPSVSSAWSIMKEWMEWIGSGVKSAVNFMIGGFVGAYEAVTKTWRQFPAVLGDAFFSGVNAAIGAINTLVQKSIEGLNVLAGQANRVLPSFMQIPQLVAPQLKKVENDFAGSMAAVGKVARDEIRKATRVDYLGNIGGAIVDQARANARARIRKQAEEKGYLDPEKPASNTRAETLAREAQAIEAQIRNLYALADAYGVSGAAALIAEARVKAESEAINKRADIEERVARQVRLAVAQRVVDAAKSTAVMREQATLQEIVNGQVRDGNVHAAQAAELLRDRIADLPLLAALEAARATGDVRGAQAAAAALDRQRAARDQLTDADRAAQILSARQNADDRLAQLREELRLIGATEEVRVRELATLKATQEAKASRFTGPAAADLIDAQVAVAVETARLAAAQRNYNNELTFTADKWDIIASKVDAAARGMAEAFGSAGRAIGDLASIYAGYHADRERAELEYRNAIEATGGDRVAIERENQKFALRSSGAQIQAYGDMVSAAKGFFKEGSTGYKALAAAEKVYRVAQLAMSLQAMIQSALETTTVVAGAGARATAEGTAGIAAQAKLPFPFNIVAMAATGAALVAAGISVFAGGGGGGSARPTGNIGTGTVLGDSEAKSESIKRAIDQLTEVDTIMLSYSREMAASLRSIDSQIGGFASLLVRAGDINASAGVKTGFNPNAIGSVLGNVPLIGGILKGLFGSKTTVVGSGLFGGPQALGDILGGGFDASYFSDVQKKSKFLGLTTGTKFRTQMTGADPTLENQFTLILRSFSDAISASAAPLGLATSDIQNRLNSFVVSIGKIDLKGLTGEEIQEKLSAVFGAAADQMANAAFPGIERFQKVGEGAFETLVRVASTVEAVTDALGLLGNGARNLSLDAKVALADQFDSIGDLTSAVGGFFERYYSEAEQAAARTAQFTRVFASLGLSMPASLAGFRQLVEAQNLTTDAGRRTYATLLQLAPAFADLQEAMNGARSAADILAERTDLERRLLEVQGNTEAIRALDLAKLDASNRALQMQIWAAQDAQEAARAADDLRKAWTDVGKSIADEVKRIRGITDPTGATGFAAAQGQFNAASVAARAGDQEAAKLLPGLSQALLKLAADAATSRQELERVQAQTAASLEATLGAVGALGTPASPASNANALLAAMTASQASTAPQAANDSMASELAALRQEVAAMRNENNAGHAATAGNTGRTAKVLETVTAESGGDAISVASAA
jgi:hypothetical protein